METLLDNGVATGQPYSWKCIALLLKVFYEAPQSKLTLTSLLREKYGIQLGCLLDSINDFQLANYLLELVTNLFPRKSLENPGVMAAPKLWDNETRNNDFFQDLEYPFRGRHGDASVINFTWNKFGHSFSQLAVLAKVTYSTGTSSKPRPLSKKQKCYIQVIYNKIYLWDGEGLFLELNLRKLDVFKDLKNHLNLKLISPFTEVVSSPHLSWLMALRKVKTFNLEFEDTSMCDVLLGAARIRKVSQVQNFIPLNFASSYEDDIIESLNSFAPQPRTPVANKQKHETEDHTDCEKVAQLEIGHHVDPSKNSPRKIHKDLASQLATPEASDPKINEDDWDLNPCSEKSDESVLFKKTKDSDATQMNYMDLGGDEQSPLVLAQKRKMIRATSRTLEILQQDFGGGDLNSSSQSSNEYGSQDGLDTSLTRLSSLEIEKFESSKNPKKQQKKKKVVKEKCTEKITEVFKTPEKVRKFQPPKVKAISSIKKRDISALEDIFGIPNKATKKPKRQQKLNNYREVVQITSQDKGNNTRDFVDPETKVKEIETNDVGDKANKKAKVGKKVAAKAEDKAKNCPKHKKRSAEKSSASMKKPLAEDTKKITKRTSGAAESAEPKIIPLPPGGSNEINARENEPEVCNEPLSEHTQLSGSKQTIAESTNLDSTTVINMALQNTDPGADLFGTSFTNKLQQQIFTSITSFSNELANKISIINEEMNKKIVQELSIKYQKMFEELQINFQNDVAQMSQFVGDIKDLLHLPEEKLVEVIRNKEFR